jgi:hypothetical protein
MLRLAAFSRSCGEELMKWGIEKKEIPTKPTASLWAYFSAHPLHQLSRQVQFENTSLIQDDGPGRS